MSNAGLALNRQEHAELLAELDLISILCEAADRGLVSTQVISSVLVTNLSREDKKKLKTT